MGPRFFPVPCAIVIQMKTQRPVQFELTEPTRIAVVAGLSYQNKSPS